MTNDFSQYGYEKNGNNKKIVHEESIFVSGYKKSDVNVSNLYLLSLLNQTIVTDENLLMENNNVNNFFNINSDFQLKDTNGKDINIKELLDTIDTKKSQDELKNIQKMVQNGELFLHITVKENGKLNNGEIVEGSLSQFKIRVDMLDNPETNISINGKILNIQELFENHEIDLNPMELNNEPIIKFKEYKSTEEIQIEKEIKVLEETISNFDNNLDFSNISYPITKESFESENESKKNELFIKLIEKKSELKYLQNEKERIVFFPYNIKNSPLGITSNDVKKIYERVQEILKSKDFKKETIMKFKYMTKEERKDFFQEELTEEENKILNKDSLTPQAMIMILNKKLSENNSFVYKINEYLHSIGVDLKNTSTLSAADIIMDKISSGFGVVNTLHSIQRFEPTITQDVKEELKIGEKAIKEYQDTFNKINKLHEILTSQIKLPLDNFLEKNKDKSNGSHEFKQIGEKLFELLSKKAAIQKSTIENVLKNKEFAGGQDFIDKFLKETENGMSIIRSSAKEIMKEMIVSNSSLKEMVKYSPRLNEFVGYQK